MWLFGGTRLAPEKVIQSLSTTYAADLRRINVTRTALVRRRSLAVKTMTRAARSGDTSLATTLSEEYAAIDAAISDCDIRATAIHRSIAAVSAASTDVAAFQTGQTTASRIKSVGRSVTTHQVNNEAGDASDARDHQDDIRAVTTELADITQAPNPSSVDVDDSQAAIAFKQFVLPNLPITSQSTDIHLNAFPPVPARPV